MKSFHLSPDYVRHHVAVMNGRHGPRALITARQHEAKRQEPDSNESKDHPGSHGAGTFAVVLLSLAGSGQLCTNRTPVLLVKWMR